MWILVIIIFFIFILFFYKQNYSSDFQKEFMNTSEIPKIIKIINKPCRNIENNSKVKTYLENHKIYISMTSSPKRIEKITSSLQFICKIPIIYKIFINIPDFYRNEEPYDDNVIDRLLNFDDKINITRFPNDIGPISKLLPTLDFVDDPESIIITIDDDIIYSPALFYELVYHIVLYPGVYSGKGFDLTKEGYAKKDVDRSKWSLKTIPKHPQKDVIEGFACIAYKRKYLDKDELLRLSKVSNNCKLSDDFIISFYLNKKNIPLYVIENKFFNWKDIIPLQYGLEEDALHKGSGLQNLEEGNVNMIKYFKCLEDIFS